MPNELSFTRIEFEPVGSHPLVNNMNTINYTLDGYVSHVHRTVNVKLKVISITVHFDAQLSGKVKNISSI